MRIKVNVVGIEKAIAGLSMKAAESKIRADKVTETYTRKMANDSAGLAPVDTGDLRASIVASPRRISSGTWEYGSNLSYARRQEYENATKKGFIRKSVWRNRNPYREALRKEMTKK